MHVIAQTAHGCMDQTNVKRDRCPHTWVPSRIKVEDQTFATCASPGFNLVGGEKPLYFRSRAEEHKSPQPVESTHVGQPPHLALEFRAVQIPFVPSEFNVPHFVDKPHMEETGELF